MAIMVSAWKNGNPDLKTGSGFGIRIPKKYFEKIKNWECIKFEGFKEVLNRDGTKISESCPEIRSQIIGRYLKSIGKKLDWENRNPHKLELHKIEGTENHWILKQIIN